MQVQLPPSLLVFKLRAKATPARVDAACCCPPGGRHITSRIKVEMHAFWAALEWLANTILFIWVRQSPLYERALQSPPPWIGSLCVLAPCCQPCLVVSSACTWLSWLVIHLRSTQLQQQGIKHAASPGFHCMKCRIHAGQRTLSCAPRQQPGVPSAAAGCEDNG